MKDLTKCIPCSECKFAIYQPHDIFTGKPRYFCGNDIYEVNEFGEQILLCDVVGGGCEFGIRKAVDTSISYQQPRFVSDHKLNNYGCSNYNTNQKGGAE